MCEKVGISRKCASSQAEDRLMNFMVWFGCVVEVSQSEHFWEIDIYPGDACAGFLTRAGESTRGCFPHQMLTHQRIIHDCASF